MLSAEKIKTPLLVVRNLSASYEPRASAGGKKKTIQALLGVDFDLAAGEALGIVGESGCGKSTLVRTLLRLVPASAGTAIMDGADILKMSGVDLNCFRARAQVVFQNPYDSVDPRMRILSIVREPLDVHRKDLKKSERNDLARRCLQEVGLGSELEKRFAHQISGGQCQRVAIARALVTSPDLLLLDEPVSSLDVSVQAQVLSLLEDLRRTRGLSMLFVSHDIRVVRRLCDRVMVLYRGRLMELATVKELMENPLHPYTRLLISSVPSLDPQQRKEPSDDQEVADWGREIATGCPFLDRCDQSSRQCVEMDAKPQEVQPGHLVACHLVK